MSGCSRLSRISIIFLMRPGPDAVVFRKDKPFFRGRPFTDLHGILHNDDNQLVAPYFLSLYLILLIVFTECGRSPKTAKLPNRIPPTVESKIGQVPNQVAALIWKSVLFEPHILWKSVVWLEEGIKSQRPKIDNFTQKVLEIWKNLPIFASYRSALWKKTLNCLKS